MSKINFLSLALVAAASLATPALAREHVARHIAVRADADAGPYAAYGSAGCVAAPRVGAFATQPWTNGNVPCEPGTGE